MNLKNRRRQIWKTNLRFFWGRNSQGLWEGLVCTAIFKMDNQQGPIIQHTELCSMLYAGLVGRRVQGRMDTCTCNAESLCCSAETTSALLIGYTNTKWKVLSFEKKRKKHLTLQIPNIDTEQLKYSSIAAGNVKWYNHFANQIGCF